MPTSACCAISRTDTLDSPGGEEFARGGDESLTVSASVAAQPFYGRGLCGRTSGHG